MKNFVRLAAAATLAVGYAAGASAQVANQPSSGSSDLWLFVSDPGAKQTFAIDTGHSIASVEPTSLSTTAKANTSSVATAGFTYSSAALSTFLGNSTDASSITWAVEAIQFNGTTTDPGANDNTLGSVVGVGSTNATIGHITTLTFGNLGTWAIGFSGDVSGFPTNNGVIPWANASVWGSGSGANPGSQLTYGAGIDQTGVAVGASTALYLMTGNGSPNGTSSYTLGNVSLTNSGGVATLTNVAPAPVPVPAALWLFGSGLLGLMGVGRRRAA